MKSFAFCLLVAGSACAAPIQLLSPTDGEIVSQLNEVQMKFVHESMAEREKYFDGGTNAAVLKKAKSHPKPIVLHWKGGQAPYRVTVKRLPDGKVFFSDEVKGHHASVDSLEIVRSWSVEIRDATTSLESTFRTEDQAPRLVRIQGVPNARDLGGRIGMDGRRIRQGLLFRTAGLNDNAPIEYYSLAEITAFHKEGKLAKMGAVGKNHARQLDRGEKLKESDMRLVKRSCYAPGKERLTPEERARLKSLYGFRTDIDLRGAKEVYGMTGSPLGPDVKWENVELVGGYGSFDKEEYFDCKRKIFRVIFDQKAYPIVFHCIGGADRTGTIAFMVEALLGVDENQLALDYLTTGLAAGVTDPKHKGWFDSMMKTYRALPGASPQEKMNGVFLKMGFTQKEIDAFREFMLEPKEEGEPTPAEEGTLRDDCWMWGHDPGVYDGKNNRNNIPLSAKVSIPDAIRYMGIPNVSVIRWKSAEPGDAYVESYRNVKRVSWVVCGRLKDYETLHAQAFRLIGAMPNLVGLDLDDYFKSGDKSEAVETETGPVSVTRSRIGHKALLALRKELDALPRRIDLRMTVYADKLRDDDAPALALADTVLFWTWNGKNISKLRENFAKYRTLAPTKRTLLGIYMWDFGAHAPIGMDFMRVQLDIAHELYMNHEIDGFVFHCTPLVNKGLEAVEYARAWLARHGDERRPNQR